MPLTDLLRRIGACARGFSRSTVSRKGLVAAQADEALLDRNGPADVESPWIES
jgi:hypothetical protein